MGAPPISPAPYHIVPGPGATRRILLICYHAAPSNEVGALRWTMMARHFAEQGWGFDILTADPASLTTRNERLFDRLPPGTRLFGVPREKPMLDGLVDRLVEGRRRLRKTIFEEPQSPQSQGHAPLMARQSAWRRGLNSFHAWREYVGDGAWARSAAEAGRRLFDPARHEWVISSGPPHMSHEGGRLLAEWTGLPLLSDFRDPWRFQEWVPLGPHWTRLAARYEARVVRRSALVVANVEPVRIRMQGAYPSARVITVTNGVDDEPVPPSPPGTKFIIGCPGTIYEGRDPTPLFQAVAQLVEAERLTPAQVGLEFMGYSGPAVEQWLRRLATATGLDEFLLVRPGGPRPRALEFMATCSMLAALQQGADLAVPAKIFEYMKFPAWLVVLATAGSATAELLAGTEAAVVDPEDIHSLTGVLSGRYLAFASGSRAIPLSRQPRFGRRFQAERLLDSMNASGADSVQNQQLKTPPA